MKKPLYKNYLSRIRDRLIVPQQDRSKITHVIHEIVVKLLVLGSILGSFGFVISILRYVEHGFHPIYLFQGAILCGLYILLIFRNKIPLQITALLLLLLVFILATVTLFFLGIVGSGVVKLSLFCILMSLVFGLRKGIYAFGLSLVLLGIFGFAFTKGFISFSFSDMASYTTSFSAWLTVMGGFALVVGVVIISTNTVQNRLLFSLKQVHSSEEKYRVMFDEAPISLLVEDLSETKKEIEALRNQGVVDFKEYFKQNPHILKECLAKRKLIDLNSTAISLFEAEGKEETLKKQGILYKPQPAENFAESFLALVNGKEYHEAEYTILTYSDTEKSIRLRWHVPSEYRESWKRIVVSVLDITKQRKAEFNSAASEEKFVKAFETSSDIVTMTDLHTGKFIDVNDAFCTILGYNHHEVIGKTSMEFNLWQSTDQRVAAMKEIKEQGRCKNIELITKNRKGDTIYGLYSGVVINLTEGPVLLSIIKDITARKHSEGLLLIQKDISLAFAESNDIKQLMDTLIDTVLTVEGIDSAGVYLRNIKSGELKLIAHRGLSPQFIKSISFYTGDSPQAKLVVKGKAIHRFHLGLGVPMDDIRKKEGLQALSIIPIKYEGLVIAVLNLASHTNNEFSKLTQDTIESIGGMIGGVIVRVRAQSALRESEERYRHLVNMSPDAVVIVQDEQCKYVNRSFTEIFGYTVEEVEQGLSIYELVGDEYKNGTRQRIAARLAGQSISRMWEIDFVARDGSRIPCETSSVLIEHDGREAHLVNIRDIRERKKTQKEREELEQKLHQAEKMEAIGQLAGGIAHDFNNQLGGILGFADLLRTDSERGSTNEEYADRIITSVKRASDLTSQLLAFARKGKFTEAPVDIHRLIFEVVSLLRHSVDKKVNVIQHLNAPIATVLGDASQLQNAILNLGLNARDAMEGGGELLFSTENRSFDSELCEKIPFEIDPGDYLEISVSDTGCGMDEELKRRIFEPFFTTKEQGKGTGMGLAAVYGTIQNHSGAIDVQSDINTGTTFRVYLPLCESESDQTSPVDVQAREKHEAGGHILVVDDENVICEIATRILTSKGYTVSLCRDGQEAVELYTKEREKIDLVLLDLIMPVMNGKETFYALKKIDSDVKILLASGYSIDEDTQEMLDRGALGFLQKPFKRAKLLEKVREAMVI